MLPRYRPLPASENYMLFWITDDSAVTAHLLTHKKDRPVNRFRRIFL